MEGKNESPLYEWQDKNSIKKEEKKNKDNMYFFFTTSNRSDSVAFQQNIPP